MTAQLHFERRGEGEPLLLLHGIGSHGPVWEPVLERLARERDVIAVDLPGFGRSRPLEGERPTVAALARAVAAFALDEFGFERAHVAGNSLGGWIGLELARTGFAESVCAFSPAGFWNAPELAWCRGSLAFARAAAERLAPRAGGIARSAAGRTALFGQLVGRPWAMDADAAAAALRNLARSPGWPATLDAAIRGRYDANADLSGTPVTVAWGVRDGLLLPWQRRRAQAALPHARVLTLAGCGHVPMNDDPDKVARTTLEASRTIGGPGSAVSAQ